MQRLRGACSTRHDGASRSRLARRPGRALRAEVVPRRGLVTSRPASRCGRDLSTRETPTSPLSRAAIDFCAGAPTSRWRAAGRTCACSRCTSSPDAGAPIRTTTRRARAHARRSASRWRRSPSGLRTGAGRERRSSSPATSTAAWRCPATGRGCCFPRIALVSLSSPRGTSRAAMRGIRSTSITCSSTWTQASRWHSGRSTRPSAARRTPITVRCPRAFASRHPMHRSPSPSWSPPPLPLRGASCAC